MSRFEEDLEACDLQAAFFASLAHPLPHEPSSFTSFSSYEDTLQEETAAAFARDDSPTGLRTVELHPFEDPIPGGSGDEGDDAFPRSRPREGVQCSSPTSGSGGSESFLV